MKKGFLFFLFFCFLAQPCFAALKISSNEKWTNLYFGQKTRFTFLISSDAPFKGSAGWRFSIGGRTLSRGEKMIQVNTDRPQTLTVDLAVPAGREDISLSAIVTLTIYDTHNREIEATHTKRIWILSKDPFKDRRQWLKTLKLALFDPVGKTADILSRSNIPYKEIRNKDALADFAGGILIIGEGNALDAHRGLSRLITERAQSGVPVICLAPTDGSMSLPEAVNDFNQSGPSSMHFMHTQIITQLDKKLDAEAWPPKGRIVASHLHLAENKSIVFASENPDNTGWPWMEVKYKDGKGRLIFCGFAVMEKWDSGPAPRHLFFHLLEYVDKKHNNINRSGN